VDDYHIRVFDDPAAVPAQAWDGLLRSQHRATPFMRHAYLAAMHASASACDATGWTPRWVTLWRGGELRAAAPCHLKAHSWGEYVFDWAWADAHHRHGLPYYPKLLCAVPFTPVAGRRLLAADDAARTALVHALRKLADEAGLSSAHALFIEAEDRRAFEAAGWLIREGVQFHWRRDDSDRPGSFADLLAGMHRHKRKNIVQERRKVVDAGVHFTTHEGVSIDAGLWDFFHHCYELTYAAHQSSPYLTRAFFQRMADEMPEHWLMFVARRQERPIASSLVAIDRTSGHAWGRYWGAIESVPCLHFEACYYQPLAWCIEQGFQCFEGGAQGEHKMARGLLPARTYSAHWLRDSRFHDAIAHHLAREGRHMNAYVDELNERSPFRSDATAS
jgi:predicted N-acyltransferase